jgi:glucose-6-phosphate 1-epimerase
MNLMVESASDPHASFNGLPCRRLTLSNGDSLTVLRQGAQLVSWVSGGQERLYLSPNNLYDGRTPIRGGVPVCFPQFNQRGPLPKHGFVRTLPWQMDDATACCEPEAQLTLRLSANADTLALWPARFELSLHLHLQAKQIQITLALRNTGDEPLAFTGALHTYLVVSDIAATQLRGLEGQVEWDAVADVHERAADPLRFNGEFDRVYSAAPQALTLQDTLGTLSIEQSHSFANTVVWNPGAEKCAALKDMPADGYQGMLCVEAAQVIQPVVLKAGEAWLGWQRLSVL